jgi:hypothetical protein
MIETSDDRLLFFETEDFAVECELTGPAGFSQVIAVILNAMSDPVTLYETNLEVPNVHFIARHEDLAGVNRRQLRQYRATIAGVTYEFERITDDFDGLIVTAYLKK